MPASGSSDLHQCCGFQSSSWVYSISEYWSGPSLLPIMDVVKMLCPDVVSSVHDKIGSNFHFQGIMLVSVAFFLLTLYMDDLIQIG
jgi:hypothetical protein